MPLLDYATQKEGERTSDPGLAFAHPIRLAEDVDASYEIASPIIRLLGFIIDVVILALACLALLLMLAYFFPLFFAFGEVGLGLANALIYLVIAFFGLFYFFVFEIFFLGRTPAKMILGMRVIMDDGQLCTPQAGLVRGFTRMVEILPPLFGSWIFFNQKRQRLGDLCAGTLVIVDSLPMRPFVFNPVIDYLALQQHFFPLQLKQLSQLSLEDFARLEHFGRRIRELPASVREAASMRTAESLAVKMDYDRDINAKVAERFIYEVHCALYSRFQQLYPDLYV